MSKSVSHRSAPTMARSTSRATSQYTPPLSFEDTRQVPPQLQTVGVRQDASVTTSWVTRPDGPKTYSVQVPLARSFSQHKPELEQVVEIDSGDAPPEYFARTKFPNPSPIDTSPITQWRNAGHQHRNSASSRRRQSFGLQTPSTPSTAGLTTATTIGTDMSRQNSFGDVLGPFEMMQLHSNTSFTEYNSTDENQYASAIPFSTSSSYPKFSSSEEQNLLVAGAYGASLESQNSFASQNDGVLAAQPPFSASPIEDMKRSQSNESSTSSSSTRERSKAMLKRQNQHAASRPLAPKAGGDGAVLSRQGSHILPSIKSKNGFENRAVAITKQPYQRPKHDRVFCDLCTEYPEGFRGAHELGRHRDRQHKVQVKKFMCIEPSDGINSQFQPVRSLSNCKSCLELKKYGAYYNAAAHLRRAHFKPKTRNRGRGSKVEEKLEKRGGKGGGDWPPMPELKRWMKEVYEHVTDGQQQEAEAEDEDEEDNCSGSFDNEDDDTKVQSGSSDLDDNTVFYADDAPMYDAYVTPFSNFTSQGMQNMQFENLPIQQGVDLSMPFDSSQQMFVDSSYASMNAYIDPCSQNFDHSLGPDFTVSFDM